MNFKDIKNKAKALVEARGLHNLTCAKLCSECGIAEGSFAHYAGVNFSELVKELREEGCYGPTGSPLESERAPSREVRKSHIVDVAVDLAEHVGITQLTREDVVKRAQCSRATFGAYLGGLENLKVKVLERAIEREVLVVIAQGIAAKHPAVSQISDDLKARAVAAL